MPGKRFTLFLDSVVLVLASVLILYAFLGEALSRPDAYVFMFGGDGAIIYYNTIFHCLYGTGLDLQNMNYPVYESLLMTDAQASITYILSHLDQLGIVRENIVGAIHLVHYVFIALACVFQYLVFRKLNINRFLALFFALTIVFLSPQILRLVSGHFGLAYPLAFTATLYFLISYIKDQKVGYGIGLFGTILFFGFNNVYVLVLLSGLGSIALLVYALMGSTRRIFTGLIFSLLPVLLVFLLIKLTAPESERIIIQWGYIDNRTSIAGLVFPATGLLSGLSPFGVAGFEGTVNLGIVNILVCALLILGFLVKRVRTWLSETISSNRGIVAIFLASLPMLIYASGLLQLIAESIPVATMFKASGRFAWPFYYALSTCVVLVIDRVLMEHHKCDRVYLKYIIVGLLMSVGAWETFVYLKEHVRFTVYDNQFSYEVIQYLKEEYEKLGINSNSYQAIYSLPVDAAWNDKFYLESNFHAEFNSIKASLATGLPMINGKFSRMGLADMNRIVQFASHPLIEREYLDFLDDRPVLLVRAKEAKLTEGEQYLIDLAAVLAEYETYELYKLDPALLDDRSVQVDCPAGNQAVFYYRGFNEKATNTHFFGSGSLAVNTDSTIAVLDSSQFKTGPANLSLYVFVDNYKFGLPLIRIQQFNGDSLLQEDHCYASASKDIVGQWRRCGVYIDVKESMSRAEVTLLNVNQRFIVDELLIKSVSDTICVRSTVDLSRVMYNNFPVALKRVSD